MKVYVAGNVSEAESIRHAQREVAAAGHALTCDWTADLTVTSGFAEHEAHAAAIADEDLTAVMEADAVLVIPAGDEPGRGLYVELGAALARAARGERCEVVIVGDQHESVFYFHPLARRVGSIDEWLRAQATKPT